MLLYIHCSCFVIRTIQISPEFGKAEISCSSPVMCISRRTFLCWGHEGITDPIIRCFWLSVGSTYISSISRMLYAACHLFPEPHIYTLKPYHDIPPVISSSYHTQDITIYPNVSYLMFPYYFPLVSLMFPPKLPPISIILSLLWIQSHFVGIMALQPRPFVRWTLAATVKRPIVGDLNWGWTVDWVHSSKVMWEMSWCQVWAVSNSWGQRICIVYDTNTYIYIFIHTHCIVLTTVNWWKKVKKHVWTYILCHVSKKRYKHSRSVDNQSCEANSLRRNWSDVPKVKILARRVGAGEALIHLQQSGWLQISKICVLEFFQKFPWKGPRNVVAVLLGTGFVYVEFSISSLPVSKDISASFPTLFRTLTPISS